MSTTEWFELSLVLAGGLIGVVGSLVTALINNKFVSKKARRDDLLAAYIEWARVIHHAIFKDEEFWMYDVVEQMKKEHPESLGEIPSSAAGKTREELARESLAATDALRAAETRLLLIETRPMVRKRVSELSEIHTPKHDEKSPTWSLEIFAYTRQKRSDINKLIEEVAGPRSGF
jgi:hypothetical protein